MIIFVDEDRRYLAFLDDPKNAGGVTINTHRKPNAAYLVLHRADCKSISGKPAHGKTWTGGDYCKIWAATPDELLAWAAHTMHATPQQCGQCKPPVL